LTTASIAYLSSVPLEFLFLDHLQISRSNILSKSGKGSEGKADCAASIGGIFLSITHPARFPPSAAGAGKEKFGG
jgi:hypothetical protein